MEQTAHIFTPQDDSLTERVRAYLRVSLEMRQFNARRQQHVSDDLLGDKEYLPKLTKSSKTAL